LNVHVLQDPFECQRGFIMFYDLLCYVSLLCSYKIHLNANTKKTKILV